MEPNTNKTRQEKKPDGYPVMSRWYSLQKSKPDLNASGNWFRNLLPDDESIIGWFEDSIKPVKAEEYFHPSSDDSSNPTANPNRESASKPYDPVYNRAALR